MQHFVDWVAQENNIKIRIRRIMIMIMIIRIRIRTRTRIITAYTAAFPQSGSSSTGIQVISASDIEQVVSTREIPLLFSRSAVGSLKSPVLG